MGTKEDLRYDEEFLEEQRKAKGGDYEYVDMERADEVCDDEEFFLLLLL